jgi:hypothetical protein
VTTTDAGAAGAKAPTSATSAPAAPKRPATVRDRCASCQVQLRPGGRWVDALRRAVPHHVTATAARRRATILGLRPVDVPPGDWFSVILDNEVARVGPHLVSGGGGWREVPAGRVRDVPGRRRA